jgi:integrase
MGRFPTPDSTTATTTLAEAERVERSQDQGAVVMGQLEVLHDDHLRLAAIAAGVMLKKGQRFGFHNFRHGLASWLVNQGTDVKTMQGLLRHSNVKTTLGLYAHQVNSSMLAAQDSMMRAMQSGSQSVN